MMLVAAEHHFCPGFWPLHDDVANLFRAICMFFYLPFMYLLILSISVVASMPCEKTTRFSDHQKIV